MWFLLDFELFVAASYSLYEKSTVWVSIQHVVSWGVGVRV